MKISLCTKHCGIHKSQRQFVKFLLLNCFQTAIEQGRNKHSDVIIDNVTPGSDAGNTFQTLMHSCDGRLALSCNSKISEDTGRKFVGFPYDRNQAHSRLANERGLPGHHMSNLPKCQSAILRMDNTDVISSSSPLCP